MDVCPSLRLGTPVLFDSEPLFCGLLDRNHGGGFAVIPESVTGATQRYEEDTGVLVTEMRCPDGRLRVTDALALRAGADLSEDTAADRGEPIRIIEVLDGHVRVRIRIEPWGGAHCYPHAGGLGLRPHRRPELELLLTPSLPLEGLDSTHALPAGSRHHLVLAWGSAGGRFRPKPPEETLTETIAAWRHWMRHYHYDGPQERLVRRAAITLKLMDHTATGAMIAAPTSSLPEAIAGPRNWDYRYAWIRDAAFSMYAMRRIGMGHEAAGFLAWVLDAVDRAGRPRVLYDVDGQTPPPEQLDTSLEGYRASAPVRWGNAAAEQRQHDVFGEILDCALGWERCGGIVDTALWERLRRLVEAAAAEWRIPDHGIWEVRTPGRPFTYSAALCAVALDRGARLAQQNGFPGDT